MGTLFYGDARTPIAIEDRALAHIKIVVLSKLRRGEGFGFSWDEKGTNKGRSTVWLNSSSTLQFEFTGARETTIDNSWVDALTVAAESSLGLTLVDQPSSPDLETVDPATRRLSERMY